MRFAPVLALVFACGSSEEPRPTPARSVPEPTVEVAPEVPEVEPTPPPFAIRISVEHERAIDVAVTRSLARGTAPGAVVLLGGADGVVFERAYGSAAVEPAVRAMTVDARFDLASVTKVFTTLAILRLVDLGRIHLADDVGRWIPELAGRTLEDLLRHRAGLRPVNPLTDYDEDRDASLGRTFRSALEAAPGRTRYSDISFVALGEVVARAMGQPLREAMASLVTEAVGSGADYRPNPAGGGPTTRPANALVVPTERAAHRGTPPPMIEGEVNDPRAWRLGGVAGHAGLFASARDVAALAEALLAPGFLTRPTWSALQRAQGARGLGVDMQRRPFGSGTGFGHGGYTGTWVWVDPAAGFYAVVLTNRVHPDGGGRGDLGALRNRIGAIAADAVPSAIPTPGPTRCGVDVLRAEGFSRLRGKRVALFTNRSGVARDGLSTRQLLQAEADIRLVRLFAPEHGLAADREGRIGDGVLDDVPVVGLFGRDRDPPEGSLDDVDVLVVDIQDVGVRFYTYAATLHRLLRAAAEARRPVMILDRPNPLGGVVVAGPVVQMNRRTFINHFALPVQHGMTLGELATSIVSAESLSLDLEVVPVRGWEPEQTWREIGLRWVPPSPNLRRLEAVELYPGVALIEGMDISVGRGTDRPFEQIGAPWLDPAAILAELEGTVPRPEPTRFVPTASRHRGRSCAGIALRPVPRPVEFGFRLLSALARIHPELLDFNRAAGLVADDRVLDAARGGADFEALAELWSDDLNRFRSRRDAALLYPRPASVSPRD